MIREKNTPSPSYASAAVRRGFSTGHSPTDHGIKPRTFALIAVAHLLAIGLIALLPKLHRPEPHDTFIEMVSLGEIDPGAGDTLEDASPDPGPPNPLPPSHAPAPPQAATPPAPKPLPQPTRVETPPPAPTPKPTPPKPTPTPTAAVPTPKPSPKPDPKPAKPTPTPVKIDLSRVVKGPTGSSALSSTPPKYTTPTGTGSGQGLSAAEVKARLAGKVGTTGVSGGTGAGKPGDPNGNPNADPYNALIKITLERAWNKPSIPEALQTYVNIRVKPDGRIQFEGLQKSSGNTEMDATVIEAVHKVPRMPQPPPAGLGNPDYVVTINFKLN